MMTRVAKRNNQFTDTYIHINTERNKYIMENKQTAEEAAALDSLLDSTLDDLADLPEFKPYPNGAHQVTIAFEKKTVNKHPAVELKMTAISTLELSEPTDAPLEKGSESSVLYMLDNEMGQGKFKEIIKILSAHFGAGKKNAEYIEEAKGLQCTVVTKKRSNKDKTAEYTDIVTMTVG